MTPDALNPISQIYISHNNTPKYIKYHLVNRAVIYKFLMVGTDNSLSFPAKQSNGK
jgi:hypothetical protein